MSKSLRRHGAIVQGLHRHHPAWRQGGPDRPERRRQDHAAQADPGRAGARRAARSAGAPACRWPTSTRCATQLDLDATLADIISPGSEWVEIGGKRKHVHGLPGRLPVLAGARELAGAHAVGRRAQPPAAGAPVRAARPTCWCSTSRPTTWTSTRWSCSKSCCRTTPARCSWSATTGASWTTWSPAPSSSRATACWREYEGSVRGLAGAVAARRRAGRRGPPSPRRQAKAPAPPWPRRRQRPPAAAEAQAQLQGAARAGRAARPHRRAGGRAEDAGRLAARHRAVHPLAEKIAETHARYAAIDGGAAGAAGALGGTRQPLIAARSGLSRPAPRGGPAPARRASARRRATASAPRRR